MFVVSWYKILFQNTTKPVFSKLDHVEYNIRLDGHGVVVSCVTGAVIQCWCVSSCAMCVM